MKRAQVFAGLAALALSAAVACNRADTNRDAQKAADNVKVAAGQAREQIADSWLTTKIQAQFFADDDIKSRYINVTSHDGVVKLKGFVESDDARRQVLEIARNTDGVKQLDAAQLLVGRPVQESFESAQTLPSSGAVATTGAEPSVSTSSSLSGIGLDDSMVTSLVQAKYYRDPSLKSRRIDVQSKNGVVTLSGQVGSDNERAQALLLARTTQGVDRVEDSLSVDASLTQLPASQGSAIYAQPQNQASAGSSQLSNQGGAASSQPTVGTSGVLAADSSIETAVKSKLASDALAKAAKIDVSSRDGVILLQGTAPNARAKQQALSIAKNTDGVVQVIDRITVASRR